MDGRFKEWWWIPLLLLVLPAVWIRRHIRLVAILAVVSLVFLLAGCESTARLVTVNVPVSIACQVQEPARPGLWIDTGAMDAPHDVQVRNLRADHDARDGYEGELRAALKACRNIGVK